MNLLTGSAPVVIRWSSSNTVARKVIHFILLRPVMPFIRLSNRDQKMSAFQKKSCDAFLETDLLALLKEWGVTKLVIGGFATEFCIDTTIRSALALGFETVVPEDGHTTADREHMPAAKVIEHHNATWPWLVTPAGGARMTRCAEIL